MAPADTLRGSSPSGERRPVAEHAFRVMGSTARVVVVDGHAGHLTLAEARLRGLEARWSRFRSDSEISRLNRAAGAALVVSRETLSLLDHLVGAWRATGGAFDPTLLPALMAAGYVASWDDRRHATWLPATARWRGDPGGIVIDRDRSLATLPEGTAIDPGGLGKGLAADIAVADLLAGGAAGALVAIGGDLRVGGRSPGGTGWVVAVEDPYDHGGAPPLVALVDGAAATSTPAGHEWWCGDGRRHHLLDPRDGRPSGVPIAAVTVLAGTGAWAEAFTKVPFALGPGEGLVAIAQAGLVARIVLDGGACIASRGWPGRDPAARAGARDGCTGGDGP